MVRRRTRILAGIGAGTVVAGAIALTAARIPFSSEVLRRRVVKTIAARMDADVELGELTLRLYPELRASGADLTIRHKGRRDLPPLISVKRFTVNADFPTLWRKHVNWVSLEGLDIEIPPHDGQERPDRPDDQDSPSPLMAHVRQVIVDEVVADNARMAVLPRDGVSKPKVWLMHELHVRSVGVNQKMPFRSTLTNGVPPGEIDTTGTFGPWQVEEPGDTPLEGAFTLDHADLSVFKGIAGIVAAHGSFTGTLDTIDVHGETSTPDFTISVSGHPFPLNTKYHAVVDATNGDTALKEVDATFLDSSLVAKGGVFDVKGVDGRLLTLDVAMDTGRIEDVMHVVMNTEPSPMTGALRLTTKLDLPPGDRDVAEKLQLNGRFAIVGGRFTNPDIQKKINDLSHRARGKGSEPEQPPRVNSNFTGRFALRSGTLSIGRVTFDVPGALVDLSGRYGLRSEAISFRGDVLMDAKISQTTSGFKSLLLKVVDPLFRKNGRTVVPIKVSGTRSDPSFGLDVGRVFKRN